MMKRFVFSVWVFVVLAGAQAQPDYEIISQANAHSDGDALLSEKIVNNDLIQGLEATLLSVAPAFHSATQPAGYSARALTLTDGSWSTNGLTVIVADKAYPDPGMEIEYDFTGLVPGFTSWAVINKIVIFSGHDGDGSRAFIDCEVEADTGSGYASIGAALVTGPFGTPRPNQQTVCYVKRDLTLTGVQKIKFRFWAVSHNSTGFFQAYDDNTTNPPLNYPQQGTIIKEIDVIGTLQTPPSGVNDWTIF